MTTLDPWQRIEWALRNVPAEKGLPTQVLLALMRYANKNGECWPSQPTLAKLIYNGTSDAEKVKRIRKATRWLQEQGLVEVEANKHVVAGVFVNHYRLTFASPQVSQTPGSHEPGEVSPRGPRVPHTRNPGSDAPQTPGLSDPPNPQVNIQRNTHSTPTSLAPSSTRTPQFRRGMPPTSGKQRRERQRVTATAGPSEMRLTYNRKAEPCWYCSDDAHPRWVAPGAGRLVREEATKHLHAAHHWEECQTAEGRAAAAAQDLGIALEEARRLEGLDPL